MESLIMALSYNELVEEDKRLSDIIAKKSDMIKKLELENEHLKEILNKQKELLDILFDKIE